MDSTFGAIGIGIAKALGAGIRAQLIEEGKNINWAKVLQPPTDIGAAFASSLLGGQNLYGELFGYGSDSERAKYLREQQQKIVQENKEFRAKVKAAIGKEGQGFDMGGVKYVKYTLDPITNTLKVIKDAVKDTPSLAKQLEAQAAETQAAGVKKVISDLSTEIRFFGDETKVAAVRQQLLSSGVSDFSSKVAQSAISLARQLDALKQNAQVGKIFDDLATRVKFFGDESQVAATKQALLAQGVNDFSSGSARAALTLAATVDALGKSQKAAQEFNDKIKSSQGYMKNLREQSAFQVKFANPTELDKFSDWVKQNTQGMRGLKGEIEATAAQLKNLQFIQGARKRDDVLKDLVGNLQSQINNVGNVNVSPIEQKLKEIAESLNLKRGVSDTDFNQTSAYFAKVVKVYIDNIKLLSRQGLDASAIKAKLTDYLASFATLVDGSPIKVFADDAIPKVIARFLELDETFSRNTLASGAEKLSAIFESLNIRIGNGGAQNALEKLTQQLNDPAVTAAIGERAKVLGYTAEALGNLLLARVGGTDTSTRLRIVPEENSLSAWDAFFSQLKSKISDFQSTLPSVKQALTDTLIDLPTRAADVFTSAIAKFDGTLKGFFKSVVAGFAQMVKEILIEQLRLQIIKGITKIIGAVAGGIGGGGGGGLTTSPSLLMSSIGGRAAGGPVEANRPYMVGEREPELFVPKTSGRIYNGQQMAQLGADKTVVNNTNNFNFYPDPKTGNFPKESATQAAKRMAALTEQATRRA